jgi:hypothetical protein
MNPLATARAVLHGRGHVCADADDGALLFCTPFGSGRIDAATEEQVRVSLDASAVADDPLAFARISSRPGPARMTLRRRAPVAEWTCDAAAVDTALLGLMSLWAPGAGATLPLIDVRPGVLAAVAPPVTTPLFVRLAAAHGGVVDRARATFLLVANADLRSGKGGWLDGPGLAVDPIGDFIEHLAAELWQVASALAVLAEAHIAESYLALCGMTHTTQPRVPSWDARTEGGCP